MKYLLKNGTLVSGAGTEQKDILIEGEKIVKIAPHIEEGDAEEINVEGKLLFPKTELLYQEREQSKKIFL